MQGIYKITYTKTDKCYIGSKCPKAKLNEVQVEEIKIKLQKPVNRRNLAKEYNVSIDVIDDILSKKNWSHIRPDIIIYKNTINKLTKEDVVKIKTLLQEGKLTQKQIAKQFGIIQQTVSNIKNKKIWEDVQ